MELTPLFGTRSPSLVHELIVHLLLLNLLRPSDSRPFFYKIPTVAKTIKIPVNHNNACVTFKPFSYRTNTRPLRQLAARVLGQSDQGYLEPQTHGQKV